jgi:hypothetical protein
MQFTRTTSNRYSSPSNVIAGFMGEVGSALMEILEQTYEEVGGIDLENNSRNIKDQFDILHICFPFKVGKIFESEVVRLQHVFKPKFTIIHSTVPVGTCRTLNAIHSPIRGIHPNLKEGIMTFPKFLGGLDASHVADVFRRAGMKVILCHKSETTELMKLLDTEYYRTCIEFTQKAKMLCDKHKVPFSEAYTLSNLTYNEGYTKLGHSEFVRPVLQPIMLPIGGHCLIPNSKLL